MVLPNAVTIQEFEIVTFVQLVRGEAWVLAEGGGQRSGMKKYIREMIDDLKHSKVKGFVPAAPKAKKAAETALPDDLSNQVLSKNAEEKVKQLDYQAQQSERLQTNS
jgi:hypothetical protein